MDHGVLAFNGLLLQGLEVGGLLAFLFEQVLEEAAASVLHLGQAQLHLEPEGALVLLELFLHVPDGVRDEAQEQGGERGGQGV